jgi:hypothetical protein
MNEVPKIANNTFRKYVYPTLQVYKMIQLSPAEVKNMWSCISSHPYMFMAWYLIKNTSSLCDAYVTTGTTFPCTVIIK